MKIDMVSAGGVVVDRERNKVLLLHRQHSAAWGYDSWHLPKGKAQAGESLAETALREVEEETGYKTKIIEYLGSLPSTFEKGDEIGHKLTHYFLMQPQKRVHQNVTEHDDLEWVDFDLARQRLTEFPIWEREEEILAVALEML